MRTMLSPLLRECCSKKAPTRFGYLSYAAMPWTLSASASRKANISCRSSCSPERCSKNIGAIAKPLIKQAPGGEPKKLAKVLIGTVHGDLHDIGKNIVTFMLDINGFEVKDIGIDVPVKTFIDAIDQFNPDIVGLSGFLTLAFDSMKETIEAIQDAGLRDKLKIMIGGGQVDETVRNYTGADAFGTNAMDAVSLCKNWMGVAA